VKFTETKLKGAFLIDMEKREDNRGSFARSFCRREFETHGLNPHVAQANASHSLRKGTMRGMHYQKTPFQEVKIVRCTRGAIYDVIIDLRINSPTYQQWVGAELTADNYRALYVPEDFAHGFVTLVDDADVFYLVSQFYAPNSECGIRHNDPMFAIQWPEEIKVVSDKDNAWPDYGP